MKTVRFQLRKIRTVHENVGDFEDSCDSGVNVVPEPFSLMEFPRQQGLQSRVLDYWMPQMLQVWTLDQSNTKNRRRGAIAHDRSHL
jgi:hypothetical protein